MFAALIIIHLLGATIWVGGHLVLAIGFLPAALRSRDPKIVLDFEKRYERIGLPALVLQAITGVVIAVPYLPEPGESITPHIAGTVGTKLLLLLVTVALAIHARYRLIPRLTSENLRPLAAHIITVTVIGVLMVVLGVGVRLGPS